MQGEEEGCGEGLPNAEDVEEGEGYLLLCIRRLNSPMARATIFQGLPFLHPLLVFL